MRPQKQKYFHDPENGTWGDCDRTCVASLLCRDIEDVPHFFEGLPPDPDPELLEFVTERGRLGIFDVSAQTEREITRQLEGRS